MASKKINNNTIKNKLTKKTIVTNLINAIILILLAVLIFIWVYDYLQVNRGKEPAFCIEKNTLNYDDGTVDECLGFGYKIYKYNRTKIKNTIEFGPLWIKVQE